MSDVTLYGPTGTPLIGNFTPEQIQLILNSGAGYTTSPDPAAAAAAQQQVSQNYNSDTGQWAPGTEPAWAAAQAEQKDAQLRALGYTTDGHGNVIDGNGNVFGSSAATAAGVAAAGGVVGGVFGAPAGTTGAPATPGSTTGAHPNATIANLFRQWGLDELMPLIDQWSIDNLSDDEILAQLYDTTSAAGKVVDRIYPEVRLRREAGKTPMTIPQIRQYRDTATQILRSAGMPTTFYDDPSDFTPWIVGDVDPQEFQQRVGIAVDWAQQQPVEVRDQLKALYGVDEGGIAAWVLDPQKGLPALQRQGAAAAISGAAVRQRFGGLTQAEAERLASLGVDFGAASQGFGALDRSRELLDPLTGQRGAAIGRDQQIGAALEGDAQAQAAIERVAGNRVGAFRGGGGVASNREGFAGLGASSR